MIYDRYLCIREIVSLFMQFQRKARYVMSTGYTNIGPGINVESNGLFSASFAAAKVAPVCALYISGITSGSFDLWIKIECKHRGEKIFSFENRYSRMDSALFDADENGRMLVRFSYDDFDVNNEFLKSLKSEISTDIVTSVSINGTLYEVRNPVTVLSANEFAGIEAHPETLAAFADPYSEVAGALAASFKKANMWTSFTEAAELCGNIINNIRAMNIICVKRDGYSPEKRQVVTTASGLAGKSSVVATPVEIAMLFCSVAECCGLDSVVVFVKNNMGIVSVYCGVNVAGNFDYCISESISKIRKSLDDGEMLLIDPAVLSSAHNVDIEHASFLASEIMHKAGTDILLSVGIGNCLKNGVLCADGKKMSTREHKKDARTVLGEIYSGISEKKTLKLMSGDYSAFDVLPLMGFDIDGYMRAFNEQICVRPMEISEKVSDFRDVSDGFASFALKDIKKKEYNKTEKKIIDQQYSLFKDRISSKNHAVAGVYEKVFHDRISRMCYGSAYGMRNYIIAGFMRMTDAKTAETLYFPLSFTEIALKCDYDYFFKNSNGGIIVNAAFASFLYGNDVSVFEIDSIEKVYAFFENLAEKVKASGDYSDVALIREFALIKADLSEAVLWDDIRRNGKRMLADSRFSALLSEKQIPSDEKNTGSYTFPRFVPENVRTALVHNGDTVIGGTAVNEKIDVAVNKTVFAVSEGKKTIVSSENPDFNKALYRELEKEGFSELMLEIRGGMTAKELCDILKKRVDEISEETTVNPSDGILTDYDKLYERINAYSAAMSHQDPILGFSVTEGVLSFFRACNTEDSSEVDILKVNENAFAEMTQHKFNVLFERAENLALSAGKALKAAGYDLSSPIKHHPLYPIKEKYRLDEASLGEIFDTVSGIISVLSDYRETFYDISEALDIDISDIKNLKGLLALNELYRIVISARELEIPESISDKEITDFAECANKLKMELGRAEAIEYRLRFFGKEIFEDVDALLSGYSPSGMGSGNFIKKFLVKKNNKDVLLQYVSDANRNEFNQQNVEEIYKLLEEYRQIKESTSITGSYLGKENSVKLAETIKASEALLEEIYPGISADEKKLSGKVGKICRFVRLVSDDTLLSKKLTYARAKFALVYSDNDCLLERISKRLKADFSVLEFDGGILSYDGLGSYLKELEKNLPAYETWNEYLDAKVAADEFMPEFAIYLENNGVKENTDRVFAASLILPAVGYLSDKYDIIKHKKNYDGAKGKYAELYEKARKLASVNAVLSYRQRIRHYTETENLSEMDKDKGLSLCAFVNKYKRAILNVFPVVFADIYRAGAMFGCEEDADLLVAATFENSGNLLLSVAGAAKNAFLLKFTEKNCVLAEKLIASGALVTDVSYSLYSSDRKLGALCGVKDYYCLENNSPAVSLITVNGTMRRVTDGANPAEAKECVTKAGDIYAKTGKKVGIFTLSHGQAAYIKHLVDLMGENDKKLAEGAALGYIKVFEPYAVSFDSVDFALVSLGAATDKDGSIGWSYGCGTAGSAIPALMSAFRCAKQGTFIVCSLSSKELAKLIKCSYEAEKVYFAVVSASKNIIVSDAGKHSYDADNLSQMMLAENNGLVCTAGCYESAADGYGKEENTLYMYDCDMHGRLFERLYREYMISGSGILLKNVSVLDRVIERLYPEKSE